MEKHLPGGVGCGEDADGRVPALRLVVEADGEGSSWEEGVGERGEGEGKGMESEQRFWHSWRWQRKREARDAIRV